MGMWAWIAFIIVSIIVIWMLYAISKQIEAADERVRNVFIWIHHEIPLIKKDIADINEREDRRFHEVSEALTALYYKKATEPDKE